MSYPGRFCVLVLQEADELRKALLCCLHVVDGATLQDPALPPRQRLQLKILLDLPAQTECRDTGLGITCEHVTGSVPKLKGPREAGVQCQGLRPNFHWKCVLQFGFSFNFSLLEDVGPFFFQVLYLQNGVLFTVFKDGGVLF